MTDLTAATATCIPSLPAMRGATLYCSEMYAAQQAPDWSVPRPLLSRSRHVWIILAD